jgi:hypothetical protein
VVLIAKREMDAVGLFNPNAPKGILMGIEATPEGGRKSFLLSDLLTRKVYSKHIGFLWNMFPSFDPETAWAVFESYVRSLLLQEGVKTFEAKNSTGEWLVELPNCNSMRQVLDPKVQLLKYNPLVLLHSSNRKYPLFDCIYRDEEGTIHTIQVTTAKTHTASCAEMEKLHLAVGNNRQVKLYYFVPSYNYKTFVTTPVIKNITYLKNITNFEVYIVSVPDPNKELPGPNIDI